MYDVAVDIRKRSKTYVVGASTYFYILFVLKEEYTQEGILILKNRLSKRNRGQKQFKTHVIN